MILDVKIPNPGESISEVAISAWFKRTGDLVGLDEDLLEIESEKATLTLPAEAAGKVEVLSPAGETVKVGQVVAKIDTEFGRDVRPEGETTPSPDPPQEETTPSPDPPQGEYAKGTPSVAAQKIAVERELDLKSVLGSGRDGRILKQDILMQETATKPTADRAGEIQKKAVEEPVRADEKVQGVRSGDAERGVRYEKLSPLRKKIAKRLVAAKNETAMLTTFNEINMSRVMEIRKRYKERFFERHGVKLGFMSFFAKAITTALDSCPALNAYIVGDEIEYHDYKDIGISVSAPKGLVVPVVRNAEGLTLAELESEILRLAQKARNLTLSVGEMTGGTFTITNGGVFGSLLSTPILNPPQSGILGMHNIVERPIALNGEVCIQPMMYVALSYDHRIVDGRESVGFLRKVKTLMEDPVEFLLGL